MIDKMHQDFYEVPTLQTLCIDYMRSSKNRQKYALSVNSGEVAHEILYNSELKTKVCKSMVLIETKQTMRDGLYQRGISCGYDVRKRLFLLGTFEGCTCYDPFEISEWSGAIHLKGKMVLYTSLAYLPSIEEQKCR